MRHDLFWRLCFDSMSLSFSCYALACETQTATALYAVNIEYYLWHSEWLKLLMRVATVYQLKIPTPDWTSVKGWCGATNSTCIHYCLAAIKVLLVCRLPWRQWNQPEAMLHCDQRACAHEESRRCEIWNTHSAARFKWKPKFFYWRQTVKKLTVQSRWDEKTYSKIKGS